MNRKADSRSGTPGAVTRKPVDRGDPEDTSLKRPAGENEPRMPHERDEAPDPLDATGATAPVGGPRQVIEQAASDVSRGLVDTERRGVPSNVPAPAAPAPQNSPGAEMPQPEGLDRKSLAKRGEKRVKRGGKDATHT